MDEVWFLWNFVLKDNIERKLNRTRYKDLISFYEFSVYSDSQIHFPDTHSLFEWLSHTNEESEQSASDIE